MAADLRAPTPSAAAELVVREKAAIIAALEDRKAALGQALLGVLRTREQRVTSAAASLSAYPLRLKIGRMQEQIESRLELMSRGVSAKLQACSLRLEQYQDRLESLNPRNVLARGYALVYDDEGRVVTSGEAAPKRMEIEFADGRIAVERTEP
jgi:exodeoxyribonuclease VII large subunit